MQSHEVNRLTASDFPTDPRYMFPRPATSWVRSSRYVFPRPAARVRSSRYAFPRPAARVRSLRYVSAARRQGAELVCVRPVPGPGAAVAGGDRHREPVERAARLLPLLHHVAWIRRLRHTHTLVGGCCLFCSMLLD